MDLNFNSQHDAGEPSTTTGANGSFEFTKETISAQPCWKHVPYVAVVPVGAIDSDTPNTPVTEPYKMTFPRSLLRIQHLRYMSLQSQRKFGMVQTVIYI